MFLEAYWYKFIEFYIIMLCILHLILFSSRPDPDDLKKYIEKINKIQIYQTFIH